MNDEEYIKTNREKAHTASKKKFWCKCDLNHIGQHGACSICGFKIKKKKKNF